MTVNIGEHVQLLPVGLNHLIENHNATRKQIKRAKYNVLHMEADNILYLEGQRIRIRKEFYSVRLEKDRACILLETKEN